MVWLLYILSGIFPNCIEVWPVRDHYEVGRVAVVIVGSQRKHLDSEITIYLTKLKYALIKEIFLIFRGTTPGYFATPFPGDSRL